MMIKSPDGTVTLRRYIALFLSVSLVAVAQVSTPRVKPPKKEKEPETQALPLPPEPPPAVIAEAGKLAFHLSPLSAKGLLTPQVHEALKALDRVNGGATYVKLRAFVAGTGDMRRVAAIVSEEFSARKMPLPVVTTIQVGALPLEGAQVVIESISAGKKVLNPNGLAFFAAERGSDARDALAKLQATAAGSELLQATCFVSGFDQIEGVHADIPVNFVQLTRLSVEPEAACEGIGRLQKPQTPASPTRLVFTGIQMAFGNQEQDLRLTYGRLGRALETVKAGYPDALVLNVYAMDKGIADKAAALARGFLGPSVHPLGSTRIVEGLPSPDATAAIDLVAAAP